MEWVAKITTVAIEMFLPAVGGGYLDRRLGTSYWALLGLVVGVSVGIWHLLLMTRTKPGGRIISKSEKLSDGKSDGGKTHE